MKSSRCRRHGRPDRSRRAGFVAGLALAVATQVAPLAAQPEHGGEAPPFDLPTLAGDQVNLADQRGKFVVLHFGTGW